MFHKHKWAEVAREHLLRGPFMLKIDSLVPEMGGPVTVVTF